VQHAVDQRESLEPSDNPDNVDGLSTRA